MPYERELEAVQRWAEAANHIALEHFSTEVPWIAKHDGTPVTAADRAIEEMLRRAIETEFRGDAILGEEEGETGEAGRRWVIDPIDGTKNFARGVPVFATLIALEIDGEPVLGMASAPALRTRWWATAGGGAFRNGDRIRVSNVDSLAKADVCTGGIDWARASGRFDAMLSVLAEARRSRGFGDFWGHMLVAQGSMEAMIEFAPLAWWDLAAPRAIVREAGGIVSDLNGDRDVRSGSCVSSNSHVHEQLLSVLRS